MLRAAMQRTQKAAKTATAFLKKTVVAVTKAASALVSALAALAGGGILLISMVVVIVISAVASSPFGLFFAQERNAPDTVSVAEAIASVNVSYNAKLEELQSGDYDSIEINGQAADMGRMSGGIGAAVQGMAAESTQPISIIVQSVLDGKIIGESSYRYIKNRERAYGV